MARAGRRGLTLLLHERLLLCPPAPSLGLSTRVLDVLLVMPRTGLTAVSVAVTCPEAATGDVIFVTTKSGLDVEVEVPEGVTVGEVFDVEFEDSAQPPERASSPIRGGGGSVTIRGGGGSPVDAQRPHAVGEATSPTLAEWSDRFAVDGTGWSTDRSALDKSEATYRPQLSPRSRQMVQAGGEVWERMHEEHARRAESRPTRCRRAAARHWELQSRPKISKLVSSWLEAHRRANGDSACSSRHDAPSPAAAVSSEFGDSRWHGRGARSPHRVVNRSQRTHTTASSSVRLSRSDRRRRSIDTLLAFLRGLRLWSACYQVRPDPAVASRGSPATVGAS